MRYFSSNFTHVIQVRAFDDYRSSTPKGLDNLDLVAEHVANVFDYPKLAVFQELVRAIEHGRAGDSGYYKSTTLSPAMAEAFWTIARVLFATTWFHSSHRGLGRMQAVVCDLNVGVSALVILVVDYEGGEGARTDPEITTQAFL